MACARTLGARARRMDCCVPACKLLVLFAADTARHLHVTGHHSDSSVSG